MIETFALELFGKRLPIEFCCLKKAKGTHHIGTGKSKGILNGTIDMRLCCKMNDTIYLLGLHKLIKSIEITDVHLDKLIVGLVFQILEVSQVTCIGKLIKVDNAVMGILVDE